MISISVAACATLSCRAGFSVPVFGFDSSKGVIYYGPIEQPKEAIPYGDKKLDEFVAMRLASWDAVKIHCRLER